MAQHIIDRIFEEEDKDFTRVLEDLIEVLIAQGVITLDMMPEKAIQKLERRRQIRMRTSYESMRPLSPDPDSGPRH